jgi:hypothetical protein
MDARDQCGGFSANDTVTHCSSHLIR